MKKIAKLLESRLFITGLLMLIQIAIVVLFAINLVGKITWYYTAATVISLLTMIDIVNSKMNPSFKLAWVIVVLCVPICGAPLYFIMSKHKQASRISKRFDSCNSSSRSYTTRNDMLISEIEKENPCIAKGLRYIEKTAYAPVYANTATKYFPNGEEYYAQLLKELGKAQKFIFMEFFIIESGKMTDGILQILKKKVAEGVEVRMLYDDFGTISKVPKDFQKSLEALGIRVCVFNKVHPIINAFLNYRDHRKIVVIDGCV